MTSTKTVGDDFDAAMTDIGVEYERPWELSPR
jgi:hypothetical protein